MSFSQDEYNQFILENKVIGFFKEPITLKSGRTSHFYINFRTVTEDAFLTEKLADFIISYTQYRGFSPDCFYGVPEGATKVAIVTQYKWANSHPEYGPGSHTLPMGRGKPKQHGKVEDRIYLGAPCEKTIVIEDVTTTGGSLLQTVGTLAESEVEIIAALGLSNRMEVRDDGKTVEEALKGKGVTYLALSNALDLLPKAYAQIAPGKDVGRAIECEFEKYGASKIKLL